MGRHASPHAPTQRPFAIPTSNRLHDEGEHVFLPEVADDRFGSSGLCEHLFSIPS